MGGHNIASEVVFRRYFRGVHNLIDLYLPICDIWMIINNNDALPEKIAAGGRGTDPIILNSDIWDIIRWQRSSMANNININEFTDKILSGIQKAVKELIVRSAANDETLIIGDEKGNAKEVPAKELLNESSE